MTPRTRIAMMIVALILLAWALTAPEPGTPRDEDSNILDFPQPKRRMVS